MAETLHSQDDVAIVKISQRFNSSDKTLEMFLAYFSGDEIKLQCTDLNYASETFRLSPRQMDDVFTAWQAYKSDQEAKAEAEEKRLAEVEAKAYALAESCPAIQIKKEDRGDGQPVWSVTIPEIGWENVERIYGADHLLSKVSEAVEYYWPIQNAYALASQCPAIKISHAPGSQLWFVYIDVPDLFGEHAHQDDIVAIVKQAIEAWKQHVAQVQ